jgi:hypothetical protein
MSSSLLSPKKLIARYFAPRYNNVDKAAGVDDDMVRNRFVCLLCYPDWNADSPADEEEQEEGEDEDADVKTYTKTRSGYTWGLQHLNGKHREEIEAAECEEYAGGLTSILSRKAIDTYDWIDWIVSDNHELSFCEKARVRRHTKGNLNAITVKTLKERMEKVVLEMQRRFSKSLPRHFGISFDGWSEFGVHYLAVFAVGPGVHSSGADGNVLLGFSPFENAGDLSAQEHQSYLISLLSTYERKTSDVLFLVGDNCAVNCKLSNDLQIPLIGCSSHRLNLAVQRYLGLSHKDGDAADRRSDDEIQRRSLIDKLSLLMTRLKTIKGKAKLSEYTDYVALKANATRWSGNYRMVRRFGEFKDDINRFLSDETQAGVLQRAIAAAMPTAQEQIDIKTLEKAMSDFQSVSLELQKNDGAVDLLDVRVLFDCLIANYGEAFLHYLAPNASIVNNPKFEAAIVKNLRKEAPLDLGDKALLSRLELTTNLQEEQQAEAEDEEGLSAAVVNIAAQQTEGRGAIDALKNHRKRQLESQFYVDMKKIPVTSNIVERFFSQVKLTLTYLRNSMLPSTLQIIMFLKLNASSMTKMTVQVALTSTISPNTRTIQAPTV